MERRKMRLFIVVGGAALLATAFYLFWAIFYEKEGVGEPERIGRLPFLEERERLQIPQGPERPALPKKISLIEAVPLPATPAFRVSGFLGEEAPKTISPSEVLAKSREYLENLYRTVRISPFKGRRKLTEEEIFNIIWPSQYRASLKQLEELVVRPAADDQIAAPPGSKIITEWFIPESNRTALKTDEDIYRTQLNIVGEMLDNGLINQEDYAAFKRSVTEILPELVRREREALKKAVTARGKTLWDTRQFSYTTTGTFKSFLGGIAAALSPARSVNASWVRGANCYKDDAPMNLIPGFNGVAAECNDGLFCTPKGCIYRFDCAALGGSGGAGGAGAGGTLGSASASYLGGSLTNYLADMLKPILSPAGVNTVISETLTSAVGGIIIAAVDQVMGQAAPALGGGGTFFGCSVSQAAVRSAVLNVVTTELRKGAALDTFVALAADDPSTTATFGNSVYENALSVKVPHTTLMNAIRPVLPPCFFSCFVFDEFGSCTTPYDELSATILSALSNPIPQATISNILSSSLGSSLSTYLNTSLSGALASGISGPLASELSGLAGSIPSGFLQELSNALNASLSESLSQALSGSFTAAVSGSLSSAISNSLSSALSSSVSSALSGSLASSLSSSIASALSGSLGSVFSGSLTSALSGSLNSALTGSISSAITGSLGSALSGALSGSLGSVLSGSLGPALSSALSGSLSSAISGSIGSALSGTLTSGITSFFGPAGIALGAMSIFGGDFCNVPLGCLNLVCGGMPNAIWDPATKICGCG